MSTSSFAVLLGFCVFHVLGSGPSMRAFPESFSYGVTKLLTIRCSLSHNYTETPSHNADHDVERVVSIVISKAMDNKSLELASVTSFDKPVQYANDDRLTVKGSLKACNSTEKRGEVFLEMVWEYPNISDAGRYRCEMSTLSSSHHQTTHYLTQDVKANSPSLSEVLGDLVAIKRTATRLGTHVFKLQEELHNAKTHLAKLSSPPRVSWESGHITLSVKSLPRKTRMGYSMVPPDLYTTLTGNVHFWDDFNKVPQTMVSITYLYTDEVHKTIDLRVVNETVSGFGIVAKVDGGFVNGMKVRWLSIGK